MTGITGKLFDTTEITVLSIIFTMNNNQVTWPSHWVSISKCVRQLRWRGLSCLQCCHEYLDLETVNLNKLKSLKVAELKDEELW